MTDNIDFINKIAADKPVRIFLPILGADERLRIQCIFQKTTAPHFKLLFKAGTLPLNKLDLDSSAIINLDIGGQSVSMESHIVKVINDQTLELVAQKTITHEQMREFFRVDLALPIIIKSLIPEGFGKPDDSWSIPGTTVDLSGSGLRISFKKAPPANTQVRLELALPTTETNVVSTISSPVRISQLTEKLWDAAYHFDEINDEDRDTIIGCCLIAQRRLLRLKVQVKGNY